MKKYFYRITLFQIKLLFFIISEIKSVENILKENHFNQSDKDDDDDDDNPPDMMKILEDLKNDIQNLSKDIAKYDTLIYVFIPTIAVLFLIIIGIIIYEVIKCCRKDEGDLIEPFKASNLIYGDENNNNSSKLKNSSTNSSGSNDSKDKKIKNSFHSSKLTESNVSKDVLKSNLNISAKDKEKESIKVSNSLNNNDEGNNGYVAPPIEDINNNGEKFLTNNGEEPEKNKSNLIENPFLKKN